MVNMAIRIFSPWVELYRGKEENTYTDLVALLIQAEIPHKASISQPGNKMATYSGAAGTHASNSSMTRGGYTNPATFKAGMESLEPDDTPKVYRIRIRACDRAAVQKLQSEAH